MSQEQSSSAPSGGSTPPPQDGSSSPPDASPASPQRPSRSVLDFGTRRTLREALEECSRRGSVCSQWDLDTDCSEDAAAEAAASIPEEGDWVTQNLDPLVSLPQKVDAELDRLIVLRSYLLLDSDPEPDFERITALATRFFDVPIALVSLVDLGRQWFMSNRGLPLDVRETPRSMAFCAHAVQSVSDMLIVPNAKEDPRFVHNPLVTGAPHIRFYAGAPLMCPEGHRLGTLCIIDDKARPKGLSLMQKQTLRELAAMVVEIMVRRRDDRRRLTDDASRAVACAAHDVMAPLQGAKHALTRYLERAAEEGKESEADLDTIRTAESCLDTMDKICTETVNSFKGHIADVQEKSKSSVPEGLLKKKKPSEGAGGAGPKEDEAGGHGPAKKGDKDEKNVVIVSDLVRSLRKMAESFPFRAQAVDLTFDVDPAVPPRIISDELKIFRSAMNYLANALQSTKKGSVRLKIYVQEPEKRAKKDDDSIASAEEQSSSLVFECEDTGSGVDEEIMSKGLFMPFRVGGRVAASSSAGLGLFSVANSISTIGGRYGYHPREHWDMADEGEEGNSRPGAVFWFSVPLIVPYCPSMSSKSEDEEDKQTKEVAASPKAKENKAPVGSPDSTKQKLKMLSLAPSGGYDTQKVFDAVSEAVEKGNGSGGNGGEVVPQPSPAIAASVGLGADSLCMAKRALVIDDSVVTRESVGRALACMGFRVDIAKDGMEGLRSLQSAKYDVVFCDFLLPVMDGIDCVKRYREWESTHRPSFRQRIIGLSEHDSADDVKQGKDAGMDDFVSKARKRREILDKAIGIAKAPLGDKRRRQGGLGLGSLGVLPPPPASSSSSLELPISRLGTSAEFSSLLRGAKPTPASIHLGFPSRRPPNVAPIKLSAALSAPGVTQALSSAAAIGNKRQRETGGGAGGAGSGQQQQQQQRPSAAELAMSIAARDAALGPGGARDAGADQCLIAVDSRAVLKALRRVAMSKGWAVRVGDDGEDGIRLLKEQTWGVVLVGDDLEDPDGPRCVAQFREWEARHRSSRQRNVFLVRDGTSASEGERARAVPAGFDCSIEKPIQREDVETLLERARIRQFDREEMM